MGLAHLQFAPGALPASNEKTAFGRFFCGLFGRCRHGRGPDRLAAGGWWVGQQASLGHLQIVVAGKVHDKVPRHWLVAVQGAIHNHALDAVDDGGHAPRRVAQVAPGLAAAGAKLAHDTGKALCPVAGAKSFAVVGDALNENLLGGRRCHLGKERRVERRAQDRCEQRCGV